MNPTSIKELFKEHDIRPNKRLGQNFLIDQNILAKIIKAADVDHNDIVLEIGPGLGTLTKELIQRAKKVIAVEKDKKLAALLEEALKDSSNLEIITADIRDIINKISLNSFKIVANLPYYITSPVIRMFLESKNPPQEMILMVQKEVGSRICASPPKMSLLAVSVQLYAQPNVAFRVPKESFWPQPKVDSSLIKIQNIKKPENIDIEKFFRVVRAGFSSPRKQLANNLSSGLDLDREEIKKALIESNLDIQIRAQDLRIEDWKTLQENINV